MENNQSDQLYASNLAFVSRKIMDAITSHDPWWSLEARVGACNINF
jgi:hypothetical protein